jgi:hypothetical protein
MKDVEYLGAEMTQIIGKTPIAIWVGDNDYLGAATEITMAFSDGWFMRMMHDQDCCETVVVEDVNGDWSDLIGHPLLVAEARTNKGGDEANFESYTYTFYTFRSVGGSVDVRWLGTSNGYYSEEVDAKLFSPEAAAARQIEIPAEPTKNA